MHDELNKALAKWIEILDVDPNAVDAMNNIDWHYRTTVENIEEAQKLDDTGLTTAMILFGIWESYANSLTVSVKKMLDKDHAALKLIDDYSELHKLITTPVICNNMLEFQQKIRNSMLFYDAPQALPMVMDLSLLGMLRRDALRSMQKMQVYQFIQGVPASTDLKYNKVVYQFPNIQSMVAAIIAHNEYGVTLCHIMDQDNQAFSYFAFGVWNGGTLTVVTDKPDWDHPEQKHMIRCPGRELEERWGQHHFPYSLLEPEFSDSGKNVTFGRREGLVLYDIEATAIHGLFNLEPDVVIWITMIFELLQERYFKQNLLLPDLSYTADQMQTQVPVSYPIMTMDGWAPPTKSTINTDDLTPDSTKHNWRHKSTRHNEWLENKFRSKVPNSLLNLVQDDTQKLLPPDFSSSFELELFRRLTDDKNSLKALQPTDFGSAEQLKLDHEWIARYNQAIIINELAHREYEEKRDDIVKWYRSKLHDRADFIIDKVCGLEWSVCVDRYDGGFSDTKKTYKFNWIKLEYDRLGNFTNLYDCWADNRNVIGMRCNGKYYCPITKSKATLKQTFVVRTPDEISLITGIPIDELPEPLQHYGDEPYSGNPILNRLDPMDWVVDNPWKKLYLNVVVPLSKTGFMRRRASMGLPFFNDWKSFERKWE